MPPSKIRFVTACQQVLALGAVLAVLTPAASVISLDVVHDQQEQGYVTHLAAHHTTGSTTGHAPAAKQHARAHRGPERCASRHPAHRVPRGHPTRVAEHDRTRC